MVFFTLAAGEGGWVDPSCLVLCGWRVWCLRVRELCAQGCGVQPVPSACAIVLAAILLLTWHSLCARLIVGVDACFCAS